MCPEPWAPGAPNADFCPKAPVRYRCASSDTCRELAARMFPATSRRPGGSSTDSSRCGTWRSVSPASDDDVITALAKEVIPAGTCKDASAAVAGRSFRGRTDPPSDRHSRCSGRNNVFTRHFRTSTNLRSIIIALKNHKYRQLLQNVVQLLDGFH